MISSLHKQWSDDACGLDKAGAGSTVAPMAWCLQLRLLCAVTVAVNLLQLMPSATGIARMPPRVINQRSQVTTHLSPATTPRIFPTRQRAAQQARIYSASSTPPKKISYYGGKLYVKPYVYLIYYGNWTAFSRNVTENFILSINQRPSPNSVSSWWGITRQYYQAIGPFGFYRRFVTPKVRVTATSCQEQWVSRQEQLKHISHILLLSLRFWFVVLREPNGTMLPSSASLSQPALLLLCVFSSTLSYKHSCICSRAFHMATTPLGQSRFLLLSLLTPSSLVSSLPPTFYALMSKLIPSGPPSWSHDRQVQPWHWAANRR